MNSLQPGIWIMSYSLGWALVHSLWQALLVYGALRIALGILNNAPARVRYNLSYLALCGISAWFLYTWFTNWQYLSAVAKDGVPTAHTIIIANTEGEGSVYTDLVLQLQSWLPVAAGLYIAGILLLMLRLLYHYLQLRAYNRKDVLPVTPDWIIKADSYKNKLHIQKQVRLLLSERVTVPMVTGFIKPLILLPVATMAQLSTEQLEAILLHELAHIKRHDYLLNILQSIMETVLFFNPFARMLSSGIRAEREHCCDDMVLEHTAQPLLYAHALAALETSRQVPLALAAAGDKKLLFNRIKRIMETKKHTFYSPAAPVILVAALIVSLVWLTPVIAQTVKGGKTGNKSTTHATTKEKITIIDDNGNKHVYHSMKDVPAKYRRAAVTPPEPLEPPAPAMPIAPMAPLAPVAPMDIEGISDSSIEIAMKSANVAIEAANLSIAAANKALAEIDWKEINEAVKQAGEAANTAMKEVDWKQINADIKEAQKEAGKAMKEAEKSRKQAIKKGR